MTTLLVEVPEVDVETARDVLGTESMLENCPKTIVLADPTGNVVVKTPVIAGAQLESVELATSIWSQARQKVEIGSAVWVTVIIEGVV